MAEDPAHVNRGQSDRIRDMLLPEGKWIASFADHLACGDASYQMPQQVRDPLFGRTLRQHREEFGGLPRLEHHGFLDRRSSVSFGEALSADFGACESADLYAGQCCDREMGCLLEDRDGREDVSRLQEFQDLPAAIRKLNV